MKNDFLKLSTIVCSLLFCYSLYAQKAVEKIVNAKGISFIQIEAKNVFTVSVSTAKTNKVTMYTSMEGEYQNEYVNTVREEGTSLFLGVEKQPIFTNPNDKLSAHKVISVSLEIIVPEYVNVRVLGGRTALFFTGNYELLEAVTGNQPVHLKKVAGKEVGIQTQNGDIFLEGCKGRVVANSKYGTVLGEQNNFGNSFFQLKSLNGNIYLQKTE